MNIQRIRDLREDSDYTQEYIAKLLNVNQRTYSRYENGEHAIPLTILSFLADTQKTFSKECVLLFIADSCLSRVHITWCYLNHYL